MGYQLVDLMDYCVKHGGTDVLLIPDCRPLLRISDGLTEIKNLPTVDLESLKQFIDNLSVELAPDDGRKARYREYGGYTFADVKYGPNYCFRIAVFTNPNAEFVIIMRIVPEQNDTTVYARSPIGGR